MRILLPSRLLFIIFLIEILLSSNEARAVAVSVSSTSGLSFGTFAVGSGGSVTISTSGVRSKTGGISLVSSDAGSVAHFLVTGDPSTNIIITLPNDGDASLSSSGHTMPISGFTVSPSSPATLNGSGSLTLSVGGTLTVDSGKESGNYSGTFDITIEYQ